MLTPIVHEVPSRRTSATAGTPATSSKAKI
jgi:hypothetical protein